MALSGSFRALYLYDVAEEIRLDKLRRVLGSEPAARGPSFRHPAPEYVRFAHPPVVQPLERFQLSEGRTLAGQLNYYDFGVVCAQLELPFDFEWDELVRFSSRWIEAPEIESKIAERIRECMGCVGGAMVNPYPGWLVEDYYAIHLLPIAGVSAARLIEEHSAEIARIVRGELAPLSVEETSEIIHSRMSYYPNDVVVAGWTAAVIYDTPEGAWPTIQLLEYANSQLLEFRHYDEVLTTRLAEFYRLLEKGTGLFRRWRLAREAERLNTVLLEVRELTERADTAIKFLSDMFSARLYRLAATRVGVPDYRRLVDDKLRTARELYQFMNDRFHQSSALILESMVVIILIIDLFYLFRGKT